MSAVDVDARPDVLVELAGAIEADERGAPRLVPQRGQGNRWGGTLRRLLGKAGQRLVTVTLSRAKETRRLRANRYLWACYGILLESLRGRAADAGVPCPFATTDALHEWFRDRTLGVTVVEFDGERIEQRATTTTLTVSQFYRYVEALRDLAFHRWQIYLETPEEMGEAEWLNGRPWSSLREVDAA